MYQSDGDRLTRGAVRILSVLVAFTAVVMPAAAAPYSGSAYEGFDYGTADDPANDANDGDLSGNTGGAGFGGAWGAGTTPGSVSAGTLTYPGLTGQGNRLTLDATAVDRWDETFRSVGQTVDAGSFYFSFLTRRNNATNRTFNFATYVGNVNGPTEKFAVGQFGNATANTNGNFALQITSGSFLRVVNAAAPVAVGTGVTHLVVVRIDFDVDGGVNERARVYVDPSATADEPAAAYIDAVSPVDVGSFDNIRPFAGGNGTPYAGVSADFDEIRLGNSWESVMGQAVPEPSGLALAGIGVVRLMGRRRRAVW